MVQPLTFEWPDPAPCGYQVRLRAFGGTDVEMVMELATDPYVPLIGTLPAHAGREQVIEWISRQHERRLQGTGLSFAIADIESDEALGRIGLSLTQRQQGRAQVGYAVKPRARGRGIAADALTALVSFTWSIPELFRLEAHIEPWNTASARVAERAGFQLEGSFAATSSSATSAATCRCTQHSGRTS